MKKVYVLAFLALSFLGLVLNSCSKQERVPYNIPYFHIHVDNKDTVEVKYNRKDEVAYKVYLSSELQYTSTTLDYEVVVGNGLQEGRDFVLKTKVKTLSFAPGMFDRSISVAWLENPVDPAKDNTLTLKLIDNSKGFNLGLPGPDGKQKQLVIVKKN